MIFKNEKSHVKKLNSFQHFGNILTDSESPAIKFFRTGLTFNYFPFPIFHNTFTYTRYSCVHNNVGNFIFSP